MVVNVAVDNGFNEKTFFPQNNGEISGSITQNWTEQAVECYKLGGDCSSCSIAQGKYSFVCQMPKVLDALIKSTGKPTSKLEVIK